MVGRIVGRLLTVIGFMAVAGTAAAQGSLSGKVSDQAGKGMAGAKVYVTQGLAQAVVGQAESGADGSYRVSGVKAGTYNVRVTNIGYEAYRKDGVAITGATTLNIELKQLATSLTAVSVTEVGSGDRMAKQAPTHIEIVNSQTLSEHPTTTTAEAIRALPGIDVISGGVVQANFVARGFNNIFSGSLLTLTDYRFNFVPSLRVNIPYMNTASNDDIDRIEVLLGPASALYGPNASSGVMHILTKSPFDKQGATASVDIGEQSLLRYSGRYAKKVSDKFAFKLSAERLTAQDFKSVDQVELAAGHQRNFDIERTAMDLRLDWRPDAKTEINTSLGRAIIGSSVEPTGLGAGQVKDWTFSAYQVRARRGKLFANVFMNSSDAGDTYLLRTGQPIVDKSQQVVAQLQHSYTYPGNRQTWVYGLDYVGTQPKTGGTINGRNEDKDNFSESGAYLHSITHLNKYWDFTGSLRYDKHSKLDKGQFSPRAGLVYNPSESQSFRLTYNKSFSNPSTNNQFLDLAAGYVGGTNASNSLFTVRALGTPSDGFQFRRDCAGGVGGLCMKSPFNTDRNAFVPANAAAFYKGAVAAAVAGGLQNALAAGLAGAGIPAPLIPTLAAGMVQTLGAIQPTSAQVGTVLRILNPTTARFNDVQASDVKDIDAIRPTISTNWEAGWKGTIGQKFFASVDWWYSERRDFVGPLIVETPNVFMDRTTLSGFVQANLAAALTPSVGAATAGALAAGFAPTIAATLGGVPGSATTGVPLGVVNPNNALSGSTDIVLAYRNFGRVRLSGLDFGGQYLLDDNWTVGGTYSWVSSDFFSKAKLGGVSDIALNAPRNKGSATVGYRDEASGVSGDLRFRRTAAFPGNSGVYIGQVNQYNLVDASMSFRPSFLGGAQVSVMATNLLNLKHSEFIGGAPLGRLIVTRWSYNF